MEKCPICSYVNDIDVYGKARVMCFQCRKPFEVDNEHKWLRPDKLNPSYSAYAVPDSLEAQMIRDSFSDKLERINSDIKQFKERLEESERNTLYSKQQLEKLTIEQRSVRAILAAHNYNPENDE